MVNKVKQKGCCTNQMHLIRVTCMARQRRGRDPRGRGGNNSRLARRITRTKKGYKNPGWLLTCQHTHLSLYPSKSAMNSNVPHFDALLEPLSTPYHQHREALLAANYRRLTCHAQRLTSLGLTSTFNLRASHGFVIAARREYQHNTQVALEIPANYIGHIYRPLKLDTSLEMHSFTITCGDRDAVKLTMFNRRRYDHEVRRGDILASFCLQQLAVLPVRELTDSFVFDPFNFEGMQRADAREKLIEQQLLKTREHSALLDELAAIYPVWSDPAPEPDQDIFIHHNSRSKTLLPPVYEDISEDDADSGQSSQSSTTDALQGIVDEIDLTPEDLADLTPLMDGINDYVTIDVKNEADAYVDANDGNRGWGGPVLFAKPTGMEH